MAAARRASRRSGQATAALIARPRKRVSPTMVCSGTIAPSQGALSFRVHTRGTDSRCAAARLGRSASHSCAFTTSASAGTSRATFRMSSQ